MKKNKLRGFFLIFILVACLFFLSASGEINNQNEPQQEEPIVYQELDLYNYPVELGTEQLAGLYKIANVSNFRIITSDDVTCYLKPDISDDGYKTCVAETEFIDQEPNWNTVNTPTIKLDFKKQDTKDMVYQFSNTYEWVTEYDRYNNYSYTKRKFNNYVEMPQNIDLTQPFSIKQTFEAPKWQSNAFNITFEKGAFSLMIDPEIGECGTINESGVYTQNKTLNQAGTCIYINASHVDYNCNGSVIATASLPFYTEGVVENISISNCNMTSGTGITIWNATNLSFYNNTHSGAGVMYSFDNVYNTIIKNSETSSGSGFCSFFSGEVDNLTIDNVSYFDGGSLFDTSSSVSKNLNFYNIYLKNHSSSGFEFNIDSTNITLINVTIVGNTNEARSLEAITIYSGYNYENFYFENINISDYNRTTSSRAIRLNSNKTTIINSYFENNFVDIITATSISDIKITNNTFKGALNYSINSNTMSGISNLTIYNNLFNSSYYIDELTSFAFNTSKTLGTNIVGGTYIGGNYWTNSSGDGFSDTCTDIDADYICDSAFNIDFDNYDYLPLAQDYTNIIPNVTQPSVYPTTAYNNTDLNTNTTYDDENGHNGTVTFVWLVNDVNVYNHTNTSVSANSFVSVTLDNNNFSVGDQVNVSVIATDSLLTTAENFSTNTVTILNTIPTVTQPSVYPTTAYNNTNLNTNTTYTDSDGSIGTITFIWLVNNVNVYNHTNSSIASGTEVSVTLDNANYSVGDQVNVSVIANDGADDSTEQFPTNTVTILNTAPSLTQPTITPGVATGTDPLNTNTIYTDIDGDLGTITFLWVVNSVNVYNHTNTSITTGSTVSVTLDPANYTNGDKVNVSVIANDGTVDSTELFSTNTIQIGNNAPNVTQPSVYPTTAYNNTDLNTNTTYGDADADTGTITFIWLVNDINVYNHTNTSVADGSFVSVTLDSNNFSVGDVVNVSVISNDGFSNSAENFSSNSVTILNTAPNVTQPSVYPTTAYNNTNLNTNTTYGDLDGDLGTITFVWLVNNVNVYNHTNTSITAGSFVSVSLHPDNFTTGSLVNVSVIANDGTVDSVENFSDNTITISNSFPVVNLESPANATSSTSASWTLQYNASDIDTAIANCTLFINDVNVSTNTTITSGTQNFSYSASVGSHTWLISCTDEDSLTTNSTTFDFTRTEVSTPAGGGGGGGGGTVVVTCPTGFELIDDECVEVVVETVVPPVVEEKKTINLISDEVLDKIKVDIEEKIEEVQQNVDEAKESPYWLYIVAFLLVLFVSFFGAFYYYTYGKGGKGDF